MTDIRVGDKVKFEGTVTDVSNYASVVTIGNKYVFSASALELVSRPLVDAKEGDVVMLDEIKEPEIGSVIMSKFGVIARRARRDGQWIIIHGAQGVAWPDMCTSWKKAKILHVGNGTESLNF